MKTHHLKFSFSLALAYFCLLTCFNNSQASEVNNSTPKIEVLEVVNSHHFSSVNYEVLRREDFIGSAQTLSDVLRNINGIQIRQISGLGNPVAISIRGSSAKQVQLYIDGLLINDSQFGSFDLNQIPTEQIESIEISKNQALGTGSTPIGGVIRINTYNPSDSKQKITLSAGSFGYKELTLLSNSAFKNHSLALGGSYLTSENDYTYLVPQSFNNPSTSIKEPLKNNDFEKVSLFINTNAQYQQHQLRFNLQYNEQDKALANYQNNSPENSSAVNSDQIRYTLQHYWLSDISYFDAITLEGIELDYSGENKDEFYLDSPIESKRNTSDYHSSKQHFGIKSNLTWQTFSVTPFIDFNQQSFNAYSEINGQPKVCNGISACDIKANQSRLNLGARIEWQSQNYPLSSYLLGSQLREKNDNSALNSANTQKKYQSDQYSTHEFGINYQLNNLKTSMNISEGIRTPTLFELFGDRGSFKGNDNLLAEEANTITLGAQYKTKSVNLSSSMYRQDIDNAIVTIFNSSGVGSYTNIGSALVNGFEFQGDASITQNLSMSMKISLIDSQSRSEFSAFDDKKLPGIYHQQYQLALSYQLALHWRIKINSSIDKELYFNRSNKFQSSSGKVGGGNPANRSLTDLSVSWHTKKYNVTCSFNNLFNEHYQDLANRPAQGRSIQLKFSIEDF